MTLPVHLRAGGVSLVLDTAGPSLPRVLHWGRDLGALDPEALDGLARVSVDAVPPSSATRPPSLPLLPVEVDGWSGTPGLAGHRDGGGHAPRLVVDQLEHDATSLAASASGAGLDVRVSLSLDAFGILRCAVEVTNVGSTDYDLAAVQPLLPVPSEAAELFDLTGRWCDERVPQRAPFLDGTHLRAGRRGRPGHDAPLLLAAGTPGFGFRHGEVWAVHVAWSGNTTYLAERLPEGAGTGRGVLGGGELLLPGEIRLAPGASYRSPDTVHVWSDQGLDGVSDRLHSSLRARPSHPSSPRPVVLNTWEAVYFDHDLARLTELADVAASVGVERFVLDDGWFGSRRDDSTGLGDWYVSDAVWPDGLGALYDHVRGLGMQCGLWVEPEMANPDSDVLRAHPDWVLTADAPPWRHQVVLDLARPEVFAHLLERLDSLVAEYALDFLKWDHNRDLHAAVHRAADGGGVPGVHRQTAALYRLLDELRDRHPGLEIESCASGGARVDLGILERTDRVWTSDTNDALDRQLIQRWTTLLLPPELCGAHVGPDRTHTTHRRLDLDFRCATALFGHPGMEWDLTGCTEAELATLRRWVELYKRRRDLLHSGRVVRGDLVEPASLLHGVVAQDGSAGLFAFVQLGTAPTTRPGRVRLPGLDPDRTYTVQALDDLGPVNSVRRSDPPWSAGGITLPGSVLGTVGLTMPVLVPAAALLLDVRSG